jgi:hypothetical protein
MQRPKPVRTGRTYLSWALFALSAALFVAVAVMWYQDRDKPEQAPVPTTAPGSNQAIHVKQALEAEGLSVEFAPGGGRSEELTVVGQLLKIDGADVYAFIYPEGVAQREDDTSDLDLSSIVVLNTRGTPVSAESPRVYMGSNVLAVMYGGDDDTAEKVQRAIEGLP